MPVRYLKVAQLPFPEIDNRCALYKNNLPTDSLLPEHLALCRQGPCGHENQNAANIVEQADVLEKWQTDSRLCPVFQKLLTMSTRITDFVIEYELEQAGIEVERYDNKGFIVPGNPVDGLAMYLNDNRIRLSLNPFQITNGRHRICAAKKFGVKRLLVDVY